MTKTKFILSQPATNSAAETVRNGAKQGLKFSLAYVYTVRANARRRGIAIAPKSLADRVWAKQQPLRTAESKLRQLFGEVGLIRSREIVASIERAFA